jgi:isoleucyl-tRNA synthetase
LKVHKPWIDEITWSKPGEPGVYRRVPEVIDAWFDSGSMPFAQWGYPHTGRSEFDAAYPADFISEAIDQTRGWFNSLLWIATLLFPERGLPRPYKTCIVLGHVADRDGKKESKSKGNYTPPEIILDRVRLEFAAVAARLGAPEPGCALIAREDYEGLDLRGESATVRIYRGDAPERFRDVEIRPAKLPRRVIELSDSDAAALGVVHAPAGVGTLPREVPGLPPECKVWVEDPSSPAPGADAFRWFFYSSNPPWNPTRHSLHGVRTQQRELPLKLRNVYVFFTIYANIDGFDPGSDVCEAGHRPPGSRAEIDRWILSELALTTSAVQQHMDAYRLYEATGALTEFVDALSNWYVRRNRDRFWATGLTPDKLDVHWTLYECLVTLAKLLAPFLPFAAEDVWQNLVRGPLGEAFEESVHLCDYPEVDAEAVDAELSQTMGVVRDLVSLGLQVRTANKLRVRQPLASAEIVLADLSAEPLLQKHSDLVRDELNVHDVHFVKSADDYVTYQVKPNFRMLGPRVGKRMPALKRALAEADGAELLRALAADGQVTLRVEEEPFALSREEIDVALVAREGFAAAAGRSGVVVLGTTLSPELIEEGLFREVLNRVQTFRKELDLEYTDRVSLTLVGGPRLISAVRSRVADLGREALAVDIALDADPAQGAQVRDVSIDGEALRIGLGVVAV